METNWGGRNRGITFDVGRSISILDGSLQIHAGSLHQLIQQLRRNAVLFLGVSEGNEHGIVAGRPSLHLMPLFEPILQSAATLNYRYTLVVTDVVGVSHERIHGGECVAFRGWQYSKRVVKVARLAACDAAANSVCGRELRDAHSRFHKAWAAAPATRTSLRGLEIEGRVRSTS